MKYIKKRPSPPEFEAWKAAHNPQKWEELKNPPVNPEPGVVYFSKSDLRKSLVGEQGFLCCYCQQRIDISEKTGIERFFPKDGDDKEKGKALMFEYTNLLAVCEGGQAEKGKIIPRQTYCDHHKLEKTIPLTPLSEQIESRFSFVQVATDKIEIVPSFHDKLDEAETTIKVLNLNAAVLQRRRGSQIAGLIFKDGHKRELISIEEARLLLESVRRELDVEEVGAFSTFCTVQIHFLNLLANP